MRLLSRTRNRNAPIVGLDLDPGHVSAAEVHVNGSMVVKRGAVVPLRRGVVRDGEIADGAALAEALKQLFEENQLSRRVRVGIANQRIVMRTLDLPLLEEPKALAAAVHAEAPDHIPMPMDQAIVDFQSLGVVQTMGGARTRVVIVAVRREMVDRVVGAARAAGLELEGIDLSAFGMVRALARPASEAVMYISAAGLVNVAVANDRGCLFTRAASGGVDEMAQTLSEQRGLTLEHARQWLSHVGVLAPLESVEGDRAVVEAARAVLEEGAHQLADTIRHSLNFYRTQEGTEPVTSGVLTGPAVGVPGLAERLSELLRLPIEPAVVPVEAGEGSPDAGYLTVAAGLAVEERA